MLSACLAPATAVLNVFLPSFSNLFISQTRHRLASRRRTSRTSHPLNMGRWCPYKKPLLPTTKKCPKYLEKKEWICISVFFSVGCNREFNCGVWKSRGERNCEIVILPPININRMRPINLFLGSNQFWNWLFIFFIRLLIWILGDTFEIQFLEIFKL